MKSFPQDIIKLKYTIMPFNIDMQVHYFVHSVEGCSVLILASHNCHCVYNIHKFLKCWVGERKREEENKRVEEAWNTHFILRLV